MATWFIMLEYRLLTCTRAMRDDDAGPMKEIILKNTSLGIMSM